MSEPPSAPYFGGSTPDPSRAKPISGTEHEQLCEALVAVVMPKLVDAATTLAARGFQVTKLDAFGELASLTARHRRMEFEAWMRFQIHGNFGQLLGSERIFWMFSMRRSGHGDEGECDRLCDLQAPELVEAIVNRFVQRCLTAAG